MRPGKKKTCAKNNGGYSFRSKNTFQSFAFSINYWKLLNAHPRLEDVETSRKSICLNVFGILVIFLNVLRLFLDIFGDRFWILCGHFSIVWAITHYVEVISWHLRFFPDILSQHDKSLIKLYMRCLSICDFFSVFRSFSRFTLRVHFWCSKWLQTA